MSHIKSSQYLLLVFINSRNINGKSTANVIDGRNLSKFMDYIIGELIYLVMIFILCPLYETLNDK